MAVTAENLDVLLRVIGLRTFQAQMAEARTSVAGVGKAAIESDAAAAKSMDRTSKRMAALRKFGFSTGLVLAGIAGEAFKLSVNYDKEITQIEAHAGASHKEAMRMHRDILKLVSDPRVNQGPIELAQGAYHLESVGLRGSKALNALRESATLAAVGNSDLESTTSAVAAAWRTGIPGAQNFRHLVAALNATVGSGNMRMNDLVAAMGTGVIPVFKTAGLHMRDFEESLALLTDEGQHADNAATHLRMSINLLAAPSKIATKMLKTIGLGQLELADRMKKPNGLIGSLRMLREHLYQTFPGKPIDTKNLKDLLAHPNQLQNLSHAQSERMNVLTRAFGGARSGATIMALIDQIDTLDRKNKQISEHTKTYAKSVAATQHTSAFQLKHAWSQVEAELVIFGDKIRGPVTKALVGLLKVVRWVVHAMELKWIKSVVQWWGKLPTPIHMAATYLGVFAGILIGLKGGQMIVFLIADGFIALRAAIASAGETAALFALENPLLLALAAIAAAIFLIVTHWKQVKQAAADAWKWIKHAVADAVQFLKHHWYAGLIAGPIGVAVVLIANHWGDIKSAAKDVIDWLVNAWNNVKRAIVGAFNAIKNAGIDIWSGMENAAGDAINFVIDIINHLIDAWNHVPFHDKVGHVGKVVIVTPADWRDAAKHQGARGGRSQAPVRVHGHPHLAGHAAGKAEGGPAMGWTNINERAWGETLWLPNGTTVQPSPASSLREPRAHTPSPAPLPERRQVIDNHITVMLDRKVLYKATQRARADDRARRG